MARKPRTIETTDTVLYEGRQAELKTSWLVQEDDTWLEDLSLAGVTVLSEHELGLLIGNEYASSVLGKAERRVQDDFNCGV